jgi:hypothetical protein
MTYGLRITFFCAGARLLLLETSALGITSFRHFMRLREVREAVRAEASASPGFLDRLNHRNRETIRREIAGPRV